MNPELTTSPAGVVGRGPAAHRALAPVRRLIAAGRDPLGVLAGPRLLALGITPRLLVVPRPPTAASTGDAGLRDLLRPFDRRVHQQRVVVVATRTACLALAAALPPAAARLLLGGWLPLLAVAAVALAVMSLGGAVCLFQGLDTAEVARLLDHRLGLHEVLGTAVEMEADAAQAPSMVARAHQAQARKLLADTSPSWVFPRLRLTGESRALTGLAALLVVVLLVGSHSPAPDSTAAGHAGRSLPTGSGVSRTTSRPRSVNPFSRFASTLRTLSRPVAPPPVVPRTQDGAQHVTARLASGPSAGATGPQAPGARGVTQASGQPALGSGTRLGAPSGAAAGAAPTNLRSSPNGAPAAPARLGGQRANADAGNNVGAAGASSDSGGQGAGQKGAPGNGSGMPGGAGQPGANGSRGGQGGRPGASGSGAPGQGSASGGGRNAGPAGRPGGRGRPEAQGQQGKGANGRPATGATKAGSGGANPDGLGTTHGGRPQPMSGGGGSGLGQADSNGARSGLGAAGAAEGALSARHGGGGVGASRVAVPNLPPNLGNDNVSSQGAAFIITGQGSHGPTTDVGRANVFRPTGDSQGSLTASAPSIGPTAPGTYVAPDTGDVAPDQQSLVKAYFDPSTTGTGQ